MKLLAEDPVPSIFGKINPPPGCGAFCDDPVVGLGKFFGVLLNVIFIIFGLMLFTYAIWGAMDWITSEGDKEKLAKARAKITNAIMGLLVLIIAFTLFGIITGDILGIVKHTPAGWQFNIPILQDSGTGQTPCPGVCSNQRDRCIALGGRPASGYSCTSCSGPDCVCCLDIP